jgi:hypothetical protein
MMMVNKYLKPTAEAGAWMEMNVSDPIITQVTVSTNHL